MIKHNRDIQFQIAVIVISLLTFFSNFFTFPGEDIQVARLDYQSGKASDFQSAIASIFYGSLPNQFFEWWQYLILIQLSLAAIGLYLLLKKHVRNSKKIYFIVIIFFFYLIINISITQSRDGIMIASTLFLLGLMANYPTNLKISLLSFSIYLFAFSFRPWLAIALFPLFLLHLKINLNIKFVLRLLFTIILIIMPSISNIVISNFFDIKPAYPQQTVMIHDLSTTYCLSPILKSRQVAYDGLSNIFRDSDSPSRLCNFYKPNTWQSVIDTWQQIENEPKFIESFSPYSLPPIKFIRVGDKISYDKLQTAWINLIIEDPKSYIQNHLYFLTQVLIAGESPSFNLKESIIQLQSNYTLINFFKLLQDIFNLPWKVFIQIHIISPAAVLILLLSLFWQKPHLVSHSYISALIIMFFIWVGLTTLGYVSDNGRYTYLPCILIYGKLLININSKN